MSTIWRSFWTLEEGKNLTRNPRKLEEPNFVTKGKDGKVNDNPNKVGL
jgi:hypothetical protein